MDTDSTHFDRFIVQATLATASCCRNKNATDFSIKQSYGIISSLLHHLRFQFTTFSLMKLAQKVYEIEEGKKLDAQATD